MLSYTRGILVAYRDVLNVIELLDLDPLDPRIDALKEHIVERIDSYIARQGSSNNVK